MNTNVLTAPVTQAPSTQTTKRSLFDFYTSGIALSKLKEGKHTATLKSHQFIAGEGADAKPYVRLELDLPDRMIVDNRFEAGFSIFLDHIKEQLGKSDDNIAVQDLLSNLISEKTQFNIWISYVTEDNRTYRNINYLPPKSEATTTSELKAGEDF
jgi:hypothetical protein